MTFFKTTNTRLFTGNASTYIETNNKPNTLLRNQNKTMESQQWLQKLEKMKKNIYELVNVHINFSPSSKNESINFSSKKSNKTQSSKINFSNQKTNPNYSKLGNPFSCWNRMKNNTTSKNKENQRIEATKLPKIAGRNLSLLDLFPFTCEKTQRCKSSNEFFTRCVEKISQPNKERRIKDFSRNATKLLTPQFEQVPQKLSDHRLRQKP